MQKYQNFSYKVDTVFPYTNFFLNSMQGKSHVFERVIKLGCYVIVDIGFICHIFAERPNED